MNLNTKLWIVGSIGVTALAGSLIANTVFITKYVNLKDGLEVDKNIRLTTEAYDESEERFFHQEFTDITPGSFYDITKDNKNFDYDLTSEFGAFLIGIGGKKVDKNSEYISINSATHKECAGKTEQYDKKNPNGCQLGASSLIINRSEVFTFNIVKFGPVKTPA